MPRKPLGVGSGNRSEVRGRPLVRRIVLTEKNARQLAATAPAGDKDALTIMVNMIVSQWINDHAAGDRRAE